MDFLGAFSQALGGAIQGAQEAGQRQANLAMAQAEAKTKTEEINYRRGLEARKLTMEEAQSEQQLAESRQRVKLAGEEGERKGTLFGQQQEEWRAEEKYRDLLRRLNEADAEEKLDPALRAQKKALLQKELTEQQAVLDRKGVERARLIDQEINPWKKTYADLYGAGAAITPDKEKIAKALNATETGNMAALRIGKLHTALKMMTARGLAKMGEDGDVTFGAGAKASAGADGVGAGGAGVTGAAGQKKVDLVQLVDKLPDSLSKVASQIEERKAEAKQLGDTPEGKAALARADKLAKLYENFMSLGDMVTAAPSQATAQELQTMGSDLEKLEMLAGSISSSIYSDAGGVVGAGNKTREAEDLLPKPFRSEDQQPPASGYPERAPTPSYQPSKEVVVREALLKDWLDNGGTEAEFYDRENKDVIDAEVKKRMAILERDEANQRDIQERISKREEAIAESDRKAAKEAFKTRFSQTVGKRKSEAPAKKSSGRRAEQLVLPSGGGSYTGSQGQWGVPR